VLDDILPAYQRADLEHSRYYRRWVRAFLAVLFVTAWSGHAVADHAAEQRADQLFRAGRDLMKGGQYTEACAKFSESDKLDSQPGTRFNIGLCSEKLGKLATASAIFERVAHEDTLEPRRQKAAQWVKDLAPRIPRLLVLVVPKTAAGVVIELDGTDVTKDAGTGVPVDLGHHEISVSADGYEPRRRPLDVTDEGKVTPVQLELVTATPSRSTSGTAPTSTASPARQADDSARRSRRTTAILLGLPGLVLLGVGTYYGLEARSTWNDAKAACGGEPCATAGATQTANSLAADARSQALRATIGIPAGALLVAAAGYLLMTMPERVPATVSASVTTSSVGVTFAGRF